MRKVDGIIIGAILIFIGFVSTENYSDSKKDIYLPEVDIMKFGSYTGEMVDYEIEGTRQEGKISVNEVGSFVVYDFDILNGEDREVLIKSIRIKVEKFKESVKVLISREQVEREKVSILY
ncbi:MAG: hypothetical protein ACRCU3_01900 [Eubacteriaceae bacterium]